MIILATQKNNKGLSYIFLILLLISIATITYAIEFKRTFRVPDNFKTIQSAINAASSGDTVLVAPGKYVENIRLRDGVILRGSGADTTIIDGGGRGNVVEGAKAAVIEGFTVTNSGKEGNVGDIMDTGISANNVPMTIANCRIVKNNAGIRTFLSTSNIVNNVVAENRVFGLYLLYSNSKIKNNIIYKNGSYGIYNSYARPEVINNTIFKNHSGIYSEISWGTIKNNIIVKNKMAGIHWGEIPDEQGSTIEPMVSYSLVWSNGKDYINVKPGKGSMEGDPLFIDIDKDDVHLNRDSPSVDRGDGAEQYNDKDGSRNDAGAYGGPLGQRNIPVSPEEVSYASLPIELETVSEPDYLSSSAWRGNEGIKAGKANFERFCAPCHGIYGKGDGPVSEALGEDPQQMDLSTKEKLSVRSDNFLFNVIKNGGAEAGLSEMMPPYKTSMDDEAIRNIIKHIRDNICKCSFLAESY